MLINDFADKVKNSKPESYRNHRGQRDISRPEESFTVLDLRDSEGTYAMLTFSVSIKGLSRHLGGSFNSFFPGYFVNSFKAFLV